MRSLHSFLVGVAIAVAMFPVSAAEPAPSFDLPRWQTGESVKLSDFPGEIVVLDFFAYWCAPCRVASREIEDGIQKFYSAQKGNPIGVPVRVLSINIERAQPRKTAEFIKQTGAELVANDFDATLLAALGGAATPFIAIIDGSRATAAAPDFRLAYRNAGFEGTQKLREIIDAIRAIRPPAAAAPASVESPAPAAVDPAIPIEKATGAPTTRRGEVSFDGLVSSDIQVLWGTLSYGQKKGGTEWKLSYSHGAYLEDYEPDADFDAIGRDQRVSESYDGGQASVRQKLNDSLAVLGAGSVYHGYTDFQSVWLSTYYFQQYNFVPGYFAPNPQGFDVSGGLRWEYQPTTGFAEAGFLYAYDQIAPGWEMVEATGQLIHNREVLQTWAPALKFENVLTPRLRALNEFALTLTTDRDPRLTYRGGVNVALGERWVWRTAGGYTHEDPTLRAWYVGSTLEYEIAPRWLVSLTGRFYHDTGEIENSLLISSAAPGLQTWQGGAALRYAGERSSFALSAAPVFADYDPVDIGTRPFSNLYKDRTWISIQAAWTLEF